MTDSATNDNVTNSDSDNSSAHPPDDQQRPTSRLLGNVNALKTGSRSARVLAGQMPEQAAALEAFEERVSAILSDLGGLDVVSALAVEQVRQHARLELVSVYLWSNLQQQGPLTGKGRTRAALSAWLQVSDRLQRSAATLGLERKSRRIPTVEDYLRNAVNNHVKDSQ